MKKRWDYFWISYFSFLFFHFSFGFFSGGLYSRSSERCAIPCLTGTYCPHVTYSKPVNKTETECMNGSTKCCYSNGKSVDGKPRLISGRIVCPGNAGQTNCPSGFYCGDSTQIHACINTDLCPYGSTEALKCNIFRDCSGQGQAENQSTAVLVFVIILIFIIVLYFVHKYRYEIHHFFIDVLFECCQSNHSLGTLTKGMVFFFVSYTFF